VCSVAPQTCAKNTRDHRRRSRPRSIADGSTRSIRPSHLIDHTLLKPEATRSDIAKICRECASILCQRLRESVLGTAGTQRTRRIARESLYRGGFPLGAPS
jgi:hypothetical protein